MGIIKRFRAQVLIQKASSRKSIAPEFYRRISQTASQSQKDINNNINNKKTVSNDIKQFKSSS